MKREDVGVCLEVKCGTVACYSGESIPSLMVTRIADKFRKENATQLFFWLWTEVGYNAFDDLTDGDTRSGIDMMYILQTIHFRGYLMYENNNDTLMLAVFII